MSPRDRQPIDLEDLVVRARRGPLNRSEQRELERALEQSAELRLAYQLGADMDRATALRGGDEALIARAANAALRQLNGGAVMPAGHDLDRWVDVEAEQKRARRGGVSRWLAAAAIMLAVVSASGIAAALWSGVVSWPFRIVASLPSAPQAPAAKPRRAHRTPLHAPAPIAIAATAVPAAAPQPAVTPAPAEVPTSATSSLRARRNSDEAGELFHSANAARRNGDFGRAERLYSELIAAHPGSDESGLARVSLGKLRLARGDAQGAESEFRRYLAAGRGQLDEEALVGQAQSFARMGRTRAEREAWQRLLIDHPSSVYAEQARARLAAPPRAAPSSQTEADHSSR